MKLISNMRNKWDNIPLAVKASTAYTISNIVLKSISFITLPLFTRILTTAQYGQYTIYSSWSGILTIFITLNLAYGSFSTAMVKFEDRRNEYIASLQGIFILLLGFFLAIYIPFRGKWNVLFDLPTGLVVLMVVEIVCNTAFFLWCGKQRFEFKYKGVVCITLLNAVIAPIVALLLVLNADEKGYARIFGYASVTIVIGAIFFFYNLKKGKRLYNKEFWKYALGFNIPLLAYYLSQIIFNQSDRIMINYYCGTDKAAMYGVAYNFAMILTFVLNAINNSYVPWYYGKLKEGKQVENKKVACGISVLMALLLICIIWYAPEIIFIMAGQNYREAIWVVPPVSMSVLLLFYSQLFINVEFFYEQKKSLVIASISAAIVNVVLNIIFIPMFGFVAAGYTTFVSYIIFVFSNYKAMKKVLRFQNINESGFDVKMLLIILGGFVAVGFIGMFLYEFLIIRIVITIVAFLIVLKYRKHLMSYLKMIKK